MKRVLAVLALLALLVTACGKKKPHALESREPTQAPAPAISQATTSQYVSLVQKMSQAIDDTAVTIAKCPVQVKADDLVCSIGWFSYGQAVFNLSTALSNAQDTTKRDFLGLPPAAIDSLVKDTVDDGTTVANADSRRTEACTNNQLESDACHAAEADWAKAKDRFMDTLARWRPYYTVVPSASPSVTSTTASTGASTGATPSTSPSHS